MNPLIISRLIEAGYEIYLPISLDDILIIETSQGMEKVFCANAFADKASSPILKSIENAQDCHYIAACDKTIKTVWLIPIELMESRTMIRLGKKYEEFVIPEPTGLTYDEQRRRRRDGYEILADQAREIAEKLNDKGQSNNDHT